MIAFFASFFFLQILKENVDILEKLAVEAEKELTELDNEEGCGILRAAAGKARLLVAQKLKQFEGLCLKNIVSLLILFIYFFVQVNC